MKDKPKYIQAYELYMSGKSIDEIAEILGVKKKVVYKYISKARGKASGEENKTTTTTNIRKKIDELENKVEKLSLELKTINSYVDDKIDKINAKILELYEEIKKLQNKINDLVAEINNLKPEIPQIEINNLLDLAKQAEGIKEKRARVLNKFAEILKYIDRNNIDIEWQFDIIGYGDNRRVCINIVPYRRLCSDGKIYVMGAWYNSRRNIDLSEVTPRQWKNIVKRIEQIYRHVVKAVQKGRIPPKHAERLEHMFKELLSIIN